MKALCCLAAMFAACSSNSGPNISPDPVIELDRNPIAVSAYVGRLSPISLQILNQGRGTLTITAVKLVGLDGGTLPLPDAGGDFDQPLVAVDAGTISDPLPVQIAGLGAGFVQINYTPHAAGTTHAMLVIDSNAPADPVLSAPVNACAVTLDGGACD